MLSNIAAIARAVMQLIQLAKRAFLAFKIKKREKLVEDIKSNDKNKQLDAIDKLRK